ncbi:MAG TPA: hypothetical protein VFW46_21505 [Stellaceae bacterium]|jgi:hypothetical protein|nr:hypothetical protein [Stellaceae bacterium]
MSIEDLGQFLVEMNARSQLQNLLMRSILQYLADNSPDPHGFMAATFEGLSQSLDRLSEKVGGGNWESIKALRGMIDEFAGVMTRDLAAIPPRTVGTDTAKA